jgi:hypothetical protein
MKYAFRTAIFALSAVILWPGPESSHAAPPKVRDEKATHTRTGKWGVYSELTSTGNQLPCWVCKDRTKGSALCPGNVLLPAGQWDREEQAVTRACELKKTGRCRTIENQRCPGQ